MRQDLAPSEVVLTFRPATRPDQLLGCVPFDIRTHSIHRYYRRTLGLIFH